ncbi:MAG: D-aminoacyl-tRNA deacylase [Methylocystaceae bacterium]
MRAVVQRVTNASVAVAGQVIGSISQGFMVLLGVMQDDNPADAAYIVDKISNLRIFEDDAGKMNRSLVEVGGEILLISQFTLAGDARKGRRPSFSQAENPDTAQGIIEDMADQLRNRGIKVANGCFGAHMQVSLVNDGPVTILLDSSKLF